MPRKTNTESPEQPDLSTRDTAAALDAVGALLRTLGKYAFDLDDAQAAATGERFEKWARHILVSAPHPIRPSGDAAEPEREWNGLRELACSIPLMPAPCSAGTTVASHVTLLYALPAMIGRDWSGCRVIVRARPPPWNGSRKSTRIRSSTACPSPGAMGAPLCPSPRWRSSTTWPPRFRRHAGTATAITVCWRPTRGCHHRRP
jgi:hypothetical protein